jgi:tetratricopeptide (TPR) repeat protein
MNSKVTKILYALLASAVILTNTSFNAKPVRAQDNGGYAHAGELETANEGILGEDAYGEKGTDENTNDKDSQEGYAEVKDENTENEDENKARSGSSVIQTGKLTVNSQEDVLIEGSRIEAGRADITAEGHVRIEAAKETSYEYKIHEKATVGLNNVKDMGIDIGKQAALGYATGGSSVLKEGRASVDIAKGEYEKTEKRKDVTSWAGSEVYVGTDLNIKSGKDITIGASEIQAGGDITLDAAGKVKIETRDEVITNKSKEIKGEITVSAGVRHTAADVYNAEQDLEAAKKAYDQANESYREFEKALDKANEDLEKGLITQDEYDSIKSDEKYYIANKYLCAENVASKTAALIEAGFAAAGSAKTLGFSGDLQLNIDGKKTETNSESTNAAGSYVLSGGNINIKSGDTTKIEGSVVNAAEDVTIDAKRVEIIAGKNTFESKTTEQEIHGTARLDTSGTFNVNVSGSKTEASSTGEYYSNSYVGGQNVTIKSSEDTIVRGGNVDANEKLKMDVGGNLLVESIQDTSKSESYTIGASIGGSKGSDSKTNTESHSVSVGANFNISKGESNWVNQQTSLTGGSVDIYVENKTTLKGAVIASESGDLVLNTGSFEYSDIKDKDRSSSVGGGLSLGISQTKGPNEKGEIKTKNNVKYSVSGDYSLRDKRQTNFATVGEGEIIVRDGNTDLSGLNRDVEIAQYETKAETGLEGSFRVDDVLVNRVGWVLNPKQAYEDIKGAGIESWEGLKEFGGDVAELYEKAGNYIVYGHFVINKEVGSHLFLDDYEKMVKNKEYVTTKDTINYYMTKVLLGKELTDLELIDFTEAMIKYQQGLARFIDNEARVAWNVGDNTKRRELRDMLWELDPAKGQELDNDVEGQRNIARAEEAARKYAEQVKNAGEWQQTDKYPDDNRVFMLSVINDDPNSLDAKVLRIIKDSVNDLSDKELKSAIRNNSTDDLFRSLVLMGLAEIIPSNLSIADVGITSGGLIGKAGKIENATANAAKAGMSEGQIVLGHYPEYVQVGGNLNARIFDIPTPIYNKMSEAERWAANQKFLDRAISRGDEIILATPLNKGIRQNNRILC